MGWLFHDDTGTIKNGNYLMKNVTKRLLQKLLVNDITYKVFSGLNYVTDRLKASRIDYKSALEYKRLREKADKIFEDRKIKNGLFKDLILSTEIKKDGSIYAMLLGSFESEIHQFIAEVVTRKYDEVINIGCALGYYALGFAKLMPTASIKAYDSSEIALREAKNLAIKNNLDHRIEFFGTYSSSNLERSPKNIRTLYFVDCEGDEINIFTRKTLSKLLNSDLIIELHINKYPELEEYFRDIFQDSHDIQIANSYDDHLKAKYYSFPQLEGLDYTLKRFITEERDVFMQWIYLSAKSQVHVEPA